jgi:hypothetical protein
MNCDELLLALNDYVDRGVFPAACQEFESHLAGCAPCHIVVDNIRGTITLFKAGDPYPLPLDFELRLRRTLRDRWQSAFPTSR